MTEATTTETPDLGAARAIAAVVVVGTLLTLGAAAIFERGTAAGVAAGAGTAALNLWVWARIARALLLGEGARGLVWALVGLAKMAVLLGGFYLLVKSGITDILPLAAGYGALPIGIAFAQLGASGLRKRR